MIKSPCIGVCEYGTISKGDIERTCKGCARTAEEIEEWYHASEARKDEIVRQSAKRRLEEEYKKDLTVAIRTAKILNS